MKRDYVIKSLEECIKKIRKIKGENISGVHINLTEKGNQISFYWDGQDEPLD